MSPSLKSLKFLQGDLGGFIGLAPLRVLHFYKEIIINFQQMCSGCDVFGWAYVPPQYSGFFRIGSCFEAFLCGEVLLYES